MSAQTIHSIISVMTDEATNSIHNFTLTINLQTSMPSTGLFMISYSKTNTDRHLIYENSALIWPLINVTQTYKTVILVQSLTFQGGHCLQL